MQSDEAGFVVVFLLTYLSEGRLFCPPYLKIFLHLDFGFLQQMLKVFDLSLERSKASEAVLVSNMETGRVLPQTQHRTKAGVTSRFAHAHA